MISVDEEERRLLSAAHEVVREGQRELHSLAEEARLLYQQRLSEWEQCRHSLEQLSALLSSHTSQANPGFHLSEGEGRVGLLRSEADLRDRHGDIAERAYRAQRVARLLESAARQLGKQGGYLHQSGDGLLQVRDDVDPDTASHDRIIQAHEQERLRLAREIHDGPAQILANAIFEMEYFERLLEREPASAKTQLAHLKRDMREGLTEVRRFIFDLRPPSLADMGLFVALRRYVADFEKHFGISADVELPDSIERLSATEEVALFRLAQEALQNVQKHAAASRVFVKGEIDSAMLKLVVEDNGRGFDLTRVASRHSHNLGLISMRERAELIGAQLQVTTAPGQGTRISVAVPLQRSTT